ncbi:MAG: hypothetical protein JXR45_09695 [Deltaproteobacteria bacterium]|nr:hypothetical protein [Deltaproteobacteria bacterium]
MFEDLTEVNTMLRETVQNWYKKAEKEGWTAGIAAGIKEGRKEGRKEGEEHGLEKGIRAAKVEIARAMKKNNESLSKIAAFTGLSEEEIELL